MDHDQRFKCLFEEFLPDFFTQFYPDWSGRFRFDNATWLKQELFPDPPQGERRLVDLVVRLEFTEAARREFPPDGEIDPDQPTLALVHIEVESEDSTTALRRRMYQYYHDLERKYQLPVLPLAVLLNVGFEGLGDLEYETNICDFRPLRFVCKYVGLPGLDGARFFASGNPFGMAMSTLMRLPDDRRAQMTIEAMNQIAQSSENEWRRFLLCECVEAYSPMTQEQREQFDQLLIAEKYKEIRNVQKTTYEKGKNEGRDEGIEQGIEIGKRDTLCRLIEIKFGPLSETVLQQLEDSSAEELNRIEADFVSAKSLKELGLQD
ncbi:MAG: hypothetical protein ACFCD0_11740 [Gemmataceae bacterium]